MSKQFQREDFDLVRDHWKSFWRKEFIGRPYVCVRARKGQVVPDRNTYDRRCEAALHGDYRDLFENIDRQAESFCYAGEGLPVFNFDLCPDSGRLITGQKSCGKRAI